MLKNVLGLHEVRVSDVMVPRADIISVADRRAAWRGFGDVSAPPAIPACPCIGETLDDPRGMVHIRDFVDFVAAAAERRPDQRRLKPVSVASVGMQPAAAEPASALYMPIDLSIRSKRRAFCARCSTRRPRCPRSTCW